MSSRYTLNSCIRGYHVYKDIWNPSIGETLLGKPEFGNIHDPYAVAVVSSTVDTIVGHLPRNISTMCHIFLRRAGNIIVQVTGRRRRSVDLPQGGLEVPCLLTFIGESKEISKLERMIVSVPSLSPIEPPLKRAKIDLEIVDEDGSTSEADAVWVKFDGSFLKQSDRLEVIQNKKLNDRHINYAQRILCRQFPNTEGLGHTLLQKRKPPKKIQNGLQIIHDRGDHWIVASNIGESNIVKVYDSVFTSVSQGTTEVILNLFDLVDSHMIKIAHLF